MSDDDRFAEIAARLDAVSQDIRKQGRASVAAQAAAESCLDAVRELQEQVRQGAPQDDAGDSDDERDSATVERVVRALLPFSDALDRAVELAHKAAEPRASSSWLARWFGLVPEPSADAAAMATGLGLLQQQLRSTFDELGVGVDARIGIPVEGQAHRVVEVRPAPDSPKGTVLAVVRPGVSVGGVRVREAEVVVSSGGPAELPESRREES